MLSFCCPDCVSATSCEQCAIISDITEFQCGWCDEIQRSAGIVNVKSPRKITMQDFTLGAQAEHFCKKLYVFITFNADVQMALTGTGKTGSHLAAVTQ